MIAKIITGSDLSGVLAYNIGKVENESATILAAPNCVTKNMLGDDFSGMRISDFALSFQSRLDANIRTENPVVHIVLSLKENDKDDETLSRIACEYMERMGYGGQPYVVVKHHDVENVHMHIVSVKVDERGRKIDDRFEKRRSNAVRKELEREFGLIEAEDTKLSKRERYLRSVELANEYVDKISFRPESVSYGERDIKRRIGTVLRYVQEYHNIDSLNAYNRVLAQFGVACFEVRGVDAKGRPYEGVEYCVVNSRGARVSRGISGSAFGKRYTRKALLERFGDESSLIREEKVVKDARKAIRYVLVNILKQWPGGISERDLAAELRKHGMGVEFFRGEDGRIFGVSFSDNLRKVSVKGSDIKFSSNAMAKFLVAERESVSAAEERALLRHIRRIYNERRKSGYHYESDLINDLPSLREEWAALLKDRVGEGSHAGTVLDRFIRERYGALGDVLAKENAYFMEQSRFAVREALKLDATLRADYLYGFGLEACAGRVRSVRNPKLGFDMDIEAGKRSPKARLFSKQERELLKVVAGDRLSEIRFDMSGYLPLFRYLDPASLLKVKRKMVSDAVDRILTGVGEKDTRTMVGELLERGYVIHAVRKGDSLEYYAGDVMEKEECHVRLSPEMERRLDALGYGEMYGGVRSTVLGRRGAATAKYRLLVEIVRASESGYKARLERRLAELQKRNARLALVLLRSLGEGDYASMVDAVKAFPSNSLLEGRKFKI